MSDIFNPNRHLPHPPTFEHCSDFQKSSVIGDHPLRGRIPRKNQNWTVHDEHCTKYFDHVSPQQQRIEDHDRLVPWFDSSTTQLTFLEDDLHSSSFESVFDCLTISIFTKKRKAKWLFVLKEIMKTDRMLRQLVRMGFRQTGLSFLQTNFPELLQSLRLPNYGCIKEPTMAIADNHGCLGWAVWHTPTHGHHPPSAPASIAWPSWAHFIESVVKSCPVQRMLGDTSEAWSKATPAWPGCGGPWTPAHPGRQAVNHLQKITLLDLRRDTPLRLF